MTTSEKRPLQPRLAPEKVAYWYFRLNGFLQIENFVIHPTHGGGQRTDADLLAVRFPYRAERLIDDANDIMQDDEAGLALSKDWIDVVIAEVKTNQPCTLNGPWTDADKRNIHRVLAAIGCLTVHSIELAAADLYRTGQHEGENRVRIRLIAIGRDRNAELEARYPSIVQLIWPEMLGFIWGRFDAYRRQKAQVNQWDKDGQLIKRIAHEATDADCFVTQASHAMGVMYPQLNDGHRVLP